jgi:hypothetical protein
MTKTYTAYFYTDANYASTEIEADTPEQALAAARKLDEEDSGDLYYQHYDEGLLVNHIEILDEDHNELAHWRDDDVLLRRAAPELLGALEAQTNAAQAVIDNWTAGNLAAAVRGLAGSIPAARAALAKAKAR